MGFQMKPISLKEMINNHIEMNQSNISDLLDKNKHLIIFLNAHFFYLQNDDQL